MFFDPRIIQIFGQSSALHSLPQWFQLFIYLVFRLVRL
eukprot:13279.XXX_889306_889419_1 [CDS] Oithona nana genome sequencing.